MRPVLVVVVLMLAGSTTACFVEPIEQTSGSSVDPAAHLRNGPRTAELPERDVRPVADDPTPSLPATVDSVRYGKVTVADASRIIAVDINGTLGSIVFSLGLGSHVVGRDTSTAFPAAARLPVVTNRGHSLDAEAVLALNPSVLLVDENTVPAAAVDQIRDSGVTVVAFPGTRSLQSNDALMRSVAGALGVPRQGEQLVARTDAEVSAAENLVPSPSGDPTMAFVYIRGRNLILLAGPGSGADDLIRSLGGTDAGTQADLTGAFTAISAEAMIKADPDVILVMTQGADTVGGLDGVLSLPGIAETDAGRNRRVVQMDETKILAFGPDVGEVLGSLARAIYT
ncbi:heme/hemin ABC transporter substrate-binding protein [Gordonia hankookensis]|uniref:ABC transporter substrate-binding protein n=1 Tax=Gordonia hankookensis TaxID=589403 RepID=A0ABR7WG19_9ACTN|nr:ABC transporter substrate-binding protein [Gordonia hankookensis]MBD1321708.1 ABC transporter substrate-binding protein [Gordonia hankookensis]